MHGCTTGLARGWNVGLSKTYEIRRRKPKFAPARNSWILCGATVEFSSGA
jgi:hypothetical protein